MGAEEWVGAKEWPAGSTSSFWNTLLVHRGEDRESLAWWVWLYLIAILCRVVLSEDKCCVGLLMDNAVNDQAVELLELLILAK